MKQQQRIGKQLRLNQIGDRRGGRRRDRHGSRGEDDEGGTTSRSFRTKFKKICFGSSLALAAVFYFVFIIMQHQRIFAQHGDQLFAENADGFMHPSFKIPTASAVARAIQNAGGIVKADDGPSKNHLRRSIMNTNTNTNSNADVGANNTTNNRNKKWAYAFMMAGVDPYGKNGGWYRAILYGVMVAAELLRNNNENGNSKADIVLMIQFLKDSQGPKKLPPEEERWLSQLNIIVKYIPLPDHGIQNFYTAQMEKFRILEWHKEYDRVLYMDGDIMPHCNLDYLFEMSLSGDILKENFLMAFRTEPSNAGFFMLAPKEGDYEALQTIITKQQRNALESGMIFDRQVGWGHTIESPDFWTTWSSKGTEWKWHGDFADQGLLYYWAKYYKKRVSILIGDVLEQWDVDASGNLTKETSLDNEPFRSRNCSCRRIGSRDEAFLDNGLKKSNRRIVPIRDFIHFTGANKPWHRHQRKKINLTDILLRVDGDHSDNNNSNSWMSNVTAFKSPQEVWTYVFWKVHERLRMGSGSGDSYKEGDVDGSVNVIDNRSNRLELFDERLKIKKAVFGGFPTYDHVRQVIGAKFGRNTSHIGWPPK